MQNRFGLKDFVTLVLIGVLALVVLLGMFQEDRRWRELQDTAAQLDEIGRQVARIQRTLDTGVVAAAPQGGASRTPAARDTSWARAGVEITWSQPWDFTTDPWAQSGFEAGGVFTEIFEGQPPNLTPYLYADVYGRRVVDLVCESLGWYDPVALTMRGRLAEAWQYDTGGMWLRVKLRDDARFSTGDPVTAEDVRWTHDDLLYNPQVEAERFRSVYTAVADIEVLGDKVLEFTFKEPRFDNFDQAFGFKVLPKAVYSTWLESIATFNQSTALLVGSGPFKMERMDPDNQWTPPSDIRLVRNDLYWGPRPAIDGLRFKSISDGVARLTAYTNGDGDMMRPSAEQYVIKSTDDEFTGKHNPHMWFNMRGGYSFIAWQCGPRNGRQLTPFHDPRVRLAMTHLIDRERIRRDISKNLVRPATGPFLSSTPQADPNITPWPHDPERAKQLLEEAGWIDRDADGVLENERGDEFEFEFTFSQGSEGTLKMVTYIQSACADVGIRCTLRPIDWSILTSILDARDFDAVTFAWSASAPENDPNQIWHSNSIENQGDNFIQWDSPDADRLIELGRATLDFDERMEVWRELHRVFHQEQPYTFLSEIPWLRFTTRRTHNLQEYPSGIEYHELWLSESLPMPN
ncbi:MAG: ABC transporter substrate-binding protein [Phycisphaerales bacterium JB039]